MDKEDFKEWMRRLTVILTCIIIVMVIPTAILVPLALTPEGKTLEFRVETNQNADLGAYPVIRQIIENGEDNYIYLPKVEVRQALHICDSLNLQLKKR